MSKFIVLAVALAVAGAVTCPGYLYSDNSWPKSVDCSTSLPTPPAGTCGFAQFIAPHEGCSYCAYKDSLGLPTIGIGYLLQKGQDQPLPSGLNFEQLVTGHQALNNEEVVQMFNADVQAAIQLDQQIFSNWKSLCCNVEMVLVDMTFVMMYKLKQFHNMIAAVEAGNWEEAASQIQSSTWCKQVHTRCTTDVAQMKKGCPAGGNNNNNNANSEQQQANSEQQQASSEQQQASSSAKSSAQAVHESSSSSNQSKTASNNQSASASQSASANQSASASQSASANQSASASQSASVSQSASASQNESATSSQSAANSNKSSSEEESSTKSDF